MRCRGPAQAGRGPECTTHRRMSKPLSLSLSNDLSAIINVVVGEHFRHCSRTGVSMRIGLFVPCYIDAFFPEVGIATLELLERLGHEVIYPRDQTCCGQPMANSGFNEECAAAEALYVRNFSGFDYVVAPSGSCVHHVRNDRDAIEQTAEVRAVRERTLEIVEFLHDTLKVDAFP